ncbi:hypothetical protein ACXIUS_28945 [Bosea thiooxidans]
MAKFKVGDRVDTKGNYSFDPGRGTVVKADDDDLYFVEIDGEEGPGCDPGWAYNGHHLVAVAPATATLTIEAGKFYKTRDGRKVGPMERYTEFGEAGWQTVSRAGDFGGKLWIDDGRRYFQSDRGGPTDLVAEWVDEPAPTPIAAKLGVEFVPFPQVGDAVLIPGVISAINQSPRGTNYNIVFETQNRRMSLHFLDEDFIVDDRDCGPDCACANNDNGPAPSADTAKAFDALGDWIRSLAVSRAA